MHLPRSRRVWARPTIQQGLILAARYVVRQTYPANADKSLPSLLTKKYRDDLVVTILEYGPTIT